MMKVPRCFSNLVALFGVLLAAGLISPAAADEGRKVKKSPLDHAVVFQDSISRDLPVRIRPFSAENADLGTGAKKNKPKYQKLAQEMQQDAPELMMSSLIKRLKKGGFDDVEQMEGDLSMPVECLIIEGEFTKLNPGSQSKRYMAGFGAGKSQVCGSGRVTNAHGDLLLKFDHCRHAAMGVFGGESEAQMTNDAEATGSNLAEFMAKWADGAYAD